MLRGIWEFPKLLNSIKKKTQQPQTKERDISPPFQASRPPFPAAVSLSIHLSKESKNLGTSLWTLAEKTCDQWFSLILFALFLVIISLSLSVYKFVHALYGPLFLVSFFRECLPRFAKKLSHTTAVHFECLQHFLLRHDRQLREEVVITDSCHGCTILPCLSSELGPVAL